MSNENRQLTLVEPKLDPTYNVYVRSLVGQEGLSQLFSYTVTIVLEEPGAGKESDADYERENPFDPSSVLGHSMCLRLELPNEKARFFSGYVAHVAFVETTKSRTVFRAQLVPELWCLTRAYDSRVFQGENVEAIVTKVLSKHGLSAKFDLTGSRSGPYLPWEYCVQYRESDFAFLSRLLEHEGIHYWFVHEEGKHQLVITDTNPAHETISDIQTLPYAWADNVRNQRDEHVWDWRETRAVVSGRHTLLDYDFTRPRASLLAASGSEVDRDHPKPDDDFEVYDPTATFVQLKGYSTQLAEDYARMRSEETHVGYASASVKTSARGVCAGGVVKVLQGPSSTKDQSFLVLRSTVRVENPQVTSDAGSAPKDFVFEAAFEVLDMRHPFRPPRVTPKPTISGLQSAVVAGKAGEDFWTDEWGRVRVQFLWDRESKGDENSACWLRVSQMSAGANWGSMFMPHLGQEVLVSFLEGDPDRPLVVGRVYNGNNKPPLKLPGNAHKSIIRDHGGNEIEFDATPGKERLALSSPIATTGLILGEGALLYTQQKFVSISETTNIYHFGTSYSCKKSDSVAVTRGFSLSVSAATKVSVATGVDVTLSSSSSFSFKAGAAFSYTMQASFSYGFSSSFGALKGTYRRHADKEVVLDSALKLVLCGGKKDQSMFVSDAEGMALSYDVDAPGRDGDYLSVGGMAKSAALAMAAKASAFSILGAWAYNHEQDVHKAKEEAAQKEGVCPAAEDIGTYSASDAAQAASGLASIGAGWLGTKGKDAPTPGLHPTPNAKIALAKTGISLLAGKGGETMVTLDPDAGFTVKAEKQISLQSKADGLCIDAKKDVQISAGGAVNLKGAIKHRHFEVSM